MTATEHREPTALERWAAQRGVEISQRFVTRVTRDELDAARVALEQANTEIEQLTTERDELRAKVDGQAWDDLKAELADMTAQRDQALYERDSARAVGNVS